MNDFTTRPDIRGTFGTVASTHWIASSTGMGILEKGGNAFDAAVATALVLQVVEPHLNGPAGDLPAIIHLSGTDETRVLCAQGVAPGGATMEHYRGQFGNGLIPGSGLLATVVPGAFDGWMLMLRDHGSMEPADVMAPAIAYARDGHPVLPRVANTIAGLADFFRSEWPSSAATWLPGDAAPQPWALFRNPDLAVLHRVVHGDLVGDELHQILVGRDDRGLAAGFARQPRIGGDQVVGLKAGHLDARQIEGESGFAYQSELRHQVFRRIGPVGLVFAVDLVAEAPARLVENHGKVRGAFRLVEILGQLPQHRGIAVDRADRGPFRVGKRRQAMVSAENIGRTIDQVEMLFFGHLRLLARPSAACKHQTFCLILALASPHCRHNMLAWAQMWHYLGIRAGGKTGFGTGATPFPTLCNSRICTYA